MRTQIVNLIEYKDFSSVRSPNESVKYPQKYFRQSIVGYMGNKLNKLIIFSPPVASLVYVGNMDDVHKESAVTALEESEVS
jgi:hypothetical protein